MNTPQKFLLIAAVGLTPVALAYGLAPVSLANFLFGTTVEGINDTHVFRAIMGLYGAHICLWILGARRPAWTAPALCALVFFMFGLVFGRGLSLLMDGMPSAPLFISMVLELAIGCVGLFMLKKTENNEV